MNLKKTVNNVLKHISSERVAFALCILLVLFSLPPRLFELASLPPLIVDEPAYLRDIDAMIKHGNYSISAPQWDGSQASIDYYPAIFLISILKVDPLLAIRLVSVLYSILGIIFFFFVVRLYTNNKIAFATSLLFSASYYYLEFSRVGWNVIHAVVLGLGGLLFTLLYLKTHKAGFYIFTAALLALCFYSYRSGSIYIAVCFLIFLVDVFIKKQIKYFAHFLIFTCVFFLLCLPWLSYITTNWEFYSLRNNVVSIFKTSLPYMNNNSMIEVFIYQIGTTLYSWIFMLPVFGNTGHVENPRYLPLVFPIISFLVIPLFWIGLFLMCKKIKTYYPFLFVLIIGLITSQVLTVYPPNGARGLIVLPAIYISIGLALFTIQKKFHKKSWINPAIFLLTIITALCDIIFYFYWMTWIQV